MCSCVCLQAVGVETAVKDVCQAVRNTVTRVSFGERYLGAMGQQPAVGHNVDAFAATLQRQAHRTGRYHGLACNDKHTSSSTYSGTNSAVATVCCCLQAQRMSSLVESLIAEKQQQVHQEKEVAQQVSPMQSAATSLAVPTPSRKCKCILCPGTCPVILIKKACISVASLASDSH